jgi:fluoroquinolone transport system permease protein
MRLDGKVQARSRLYHIGIGLAIVLGVTARLLLEENALRASLPILILLGMGNTTYVFVAGMILFEKSERTLDAIIVSPLSVPVYLSSKIITLTGFAMVETAILVAISLGVVGFNPWLLALGAATIGVMYCLTGLIQIVRYRSVTDWLMPGAVVVGIIPGLPIFDMLNIWPSPLWYLIPTYAPLLILTAAFRSITTWEWVYAIGYSALIIGVGLVLARSEFTKHIVRRRT